MSYIEQLSKLTGIPPNRLRGVLWQELSVDWIERAKMLGIGVIAAWYVEMIERSERDK